MPVITLAPGVRRRGGTLEFGAKGVRLTRDNVPEDVTICSPEQEAAVLNDVTVADLGTLVLRGVRTTGQVLILARDAGNTAPPPAQGGRGDLQWTRPALLGLRLLLVPAAVVVVLPSLPDGLEAQVGDNGLGQERSAERGGHRQWLPLRRQEQWRWATSRRAVGRIEAVPSADPNAVAYRTSTPTAPRPRGRP